MDPLTHSVLGALTIRTIIARKTNHFLAPSTCMIVTALAAVFPDIDYLVFWIDPLIFLADIHRGPTHSILLLPIWALLLGCTLAGMTRQAEKRLLFSGLCAIGILTHIAADVLTVYGTQLLYPLSTRSFTLGITFVVDPYFSAIVLLSLVCSIRWQHRYVAVFGLFCLLAYLVLQTQLRHQAMITVKTYADGLANDVLSVHVIPQPLSPFNWQLIVIQKEAYHVALVNLGTRFITRPFWSRVLPVELAHHYRDQSRLSWRRYNRWGPLTVQKFTRDAWQQEQFAGFRRFAQLPVLYRVDQSHATCAWFTDLRYLLPSITPPFRYGMCRQVGKPWRLYRLQRFTNNQRQLL